MTTLGQKKPVNNGKWYFTLYRSLLGGPCCDTVDAGVVVYKE